MSFKSIYQSSLDGALFGRAQASVAKGQMSRSVSVDPTQVTPDIWWGVISDPAIEAAYADALANNVPEPGGNENLITDAMIQTAVDANWPA